MKFTLGDFVIIFLYRMPKNQREFRLFRDL